MGRHCRKWGVITTATVAVTIAACGSRTDSPPDLLDGSASDGTGPNAGDASRGDGSDGDGASSPDAIPPEPCDALPVGTWTITYSDDSGGPLGCALSPTSELRLGVDAGPKGIDFQPCELALGATECRQGAAFERDQCAVYATASSEAMFSGEYQCVNRGLTLFFHGDRAVGTMVYTKCWCTSPLGDSVTYRATAVKSAQRGLISFPLTE